MDTPFTWTVDVESNEGGRSPSCLGIKEGIPRILSLFQKHNIKGLFFISTEVIPECRTELKLIQSQGHEIGSHGHFHIAYKDKWRWEIDRQISETLLAPYKSLSQKVIRYRAPKFNRQDNGDIYSCKEGHVSLLRYMWLKTPISKETIIYLHPFDIVGSDDPPNLFCRLWYSNPRRAYETLCNLVSKYPGNHRLREVPKKA